MLQQLMVVFCWFGLLQQRLPLPPGCWSFVGSGLTSFCCMPNVEWTMSRLSSASDPCGLKHSHGTMLPLDTSAIQAILAFMHNPCSCNGECFWATFLKGSTQDLRQRSGCVIASRNYQFKLATTAATWALQLSFSLQRNAVGLTMS